MDQLESGDLEIINESLSNWLLGNYSFAQRMKTAREPDGRSSWREIADLGWLGLGIPETFGGIGGSSRDALVTAAPFGRSLMLEPYFSTVVLCAELIRRHGTEEQKAELLPAIACGDLKLAFALSETDCNFSLHSPNTAAVEREGVWRLSGRKSVVYDAPSADKLIVVAHSSAETGHGPSHALFLVEKDQPEVVLSTYRTVDEKLAADIEFLNAAAVRLGAPFSSSEDLATLLEAPIVYLCVEALAIAQAIYDETLVHLKTRRQFGKALSEFQALQHRAVEMLIRLESFRSLVEACSADFSNASEKSRAVAAAKAYVHGSAIWIARQSIQLHGGMGVSDELIIGHYFRRLMAIDAILGNSEHHARNFSRLTEEIERA